MQVKVRHRLAGLAIGVDDHPEAAFGNAQLARQARSDQMQVTEQTGILRLRLEQALHMARGDYQHMHRRLGVEVVKGDDAVILIYQVCRQFATGNLAENAFCHLTSLRGRNFALQAAGSWRERPPAGIQGGGDASGVELHMGQPDSR